MVTCLDINQCPPFKASVLTMGTFDGLHKGHQELIGRLTSYARQRGLPSVMVTFHPHPQYVVNPDYPTPLRLLTTIEEKEKLLNLLTDLDYLVIIPFSKEIASLSASQFLENFILNVFHPVHLIVGHDHRFGKGRQGDSTLLKEYGRKHNFTVEVLQPVKSGAIRISSTFIRELIHKGEIEKANVLLGYHYLLKGRVIRGEGRGKTLGFPTANIRPLDEKKKLPANGVYLVAVNLHDVSYYGMCNIGVRPTFHENNLTIEVHIFSQNNRNLYDQDIELQFIKRIREERRFSSVEALKAQLKKDKEKMLKIVQKISGGKECQ